MPPSQLREQLDRIENAIIGNGREGLLGRTARIEEKLESASKLAESAKETSDNAMDKAEEAITRAAEAVNKLAINITKLENSMATHVGTDHLSVLMKKKEFWAMIIVGFIALHLIATYVPNVWDAIMMVVGLPKLIVPIK